MKSTSFHMKLASLNMLKKWTYHTIGSFIILWTKNHMKNETKISYKTQKYNDRKYTHHFFFVLISKTVPLFFVCMFSFSCLSSNDSNDSYDIKFALSYNRFHMKTQLISFMYLVIHPIKVKIYIYLYIYPKLIPSC